MNSNDLTAASATSSPRDNPLLAAPHRAARRAAWGIVVGTAAVSGIGGLLVAVSETSRHFKYLEDWGAALGMITILLVCPLATTLAMMRHLRRAYRRAATNGAHEEWRATPSAPSPFIAHLALAVQRPFRAACLAAPIVSTLLFVLPTEIVRATGLSSHNSWLLVTLAILAPISLTATWIAYVPALFFAGPLGHAVQLIGRLGGADAATWDPAWDEAWTEPGSIWAGERATRRIGLPTMAALLGAASFIGWLTLKFVAREHEWNTAVSPERWTALAIAAVLVGVGAVLLAARRLARR